KLSPLERGDADRQRGKKGKFKSKNLDKLLSETLSGLPACHTPLLPCRQAGL
ncbi:MAG: hypothetical protein PWP52_1970, partial [Bacteroidales bacterium]|nr:hypothetical protein [Bacteroidales bacterium]